MPIYDYRCGVGHVTELFGSMSDHPQKIDCPEPCGKPAERVFLSVPYMDVDHTDRTFYLDAGQHFSTRGDRKRWMKDNGLAEVDSGDARRAGERLAEYREVQRDKAKV